jgi:hypothetical protein
LILRNRLNIYIERIKNFLLRRLAVAAVKSAGGLTLFKKKHTHEIRVAARVHHNGYGYTQLNLNLNRIFWFFGVKDLNQTFKLVIK